MARDTKLGQEGDHPRHPECREEALKNLDEAALSISVPRSIRATSWSAR